jgi:hypothetical protein
MGEVFCGLKSPYLAALSRMIARVIATGITRTHFGIEKAGCPV